MESGFDYWSEKAALDWQVEMGVDEAIGDVPIDRYALENKKPAPKITDPKEKVPPIVAAPEAVDPVAVAKLAAAAAGDLDGLRAAMTAFEPCALKSAARNLIFSDGTAGAPVMIVTDAPDRNDDRAGVLFSGPSGVLLDKMLSAIDLSREASVYSAPVLPWNPPQNRDLTADERAMMMPFLRRHIELAAPKVIVLMGNSPCQMLLGKSGMTRLRGSWTHIDTTSAIPIFAPAYLLQNAAAKRDAWADLLSLKAHLKDLA
jgi:DNA polymerase